MRTQQAAGWTRRLFLGGLSLAGSAGFLGLSTKLMAKAHAQRTAQGYVLGPAEGEHLIRNKGSILIKVDPTRGSEYLALGTQQVPLGAGIPVHQHTQSDEVFYVVEGNGTLILNDANLPVEKGATAFVPKGAWHGFQNPGAELLLLWIVAPPGLEAFFREVASPPDVPPKSLTRDQLNEIAGRHGMRYR
jgi:quercetin dioxygenase-like cupin family protein